MFIGKQDREELGKTINKNNKTGTIQLETKIIISLSKRKGTL